jgi:hypothetical protein
LQEIVLGCTVRTLLRFSVGVLLVLGVSLASYLHPVENDFDRFIYEAIILSRSRPIDAVYNIVKHENRRAEASSVLDSPQHLQEIEPMFAIRPLYLLIVSWVAVFIPLPHAINAVSAISFFGVGLVAIAWSRRPILTGMFMSAYPLLLLARIGSPDALSALLVISGLWLVAECKLEAAGLLLLFLSLSARTDNLLLVLIVLVWLAWEKRLSYLFAAAVASFSVALVLAINHWAGNYGWIVLFRCSFVDPLRWPAGAGHSLSLREYTSALVRALTTIAVHVTLWVLLGILAWMRRHDRVLIVVAVAAAAHFLLFPSPEDRYFLWAYIVAGVSLIRSVSPSDVARGALRGAETIPDEMLAARRKSAGIPIHAPL